MWLLIGWLLGRRWQGPRVERRRRGHPWLFVLVVFMAIGAFGTGAIGWGLILLGVAAALVAAGINPR